MATGHAWSCCTRRSTRDEASISILPHSVFSSAFHCVCRHSRHKCKMNIVVIRIRHFAAINLFRSSQLNTMTQQTRESTTNRLSGVWALDCIDCSGLGNGMLFYSSSVILQQYFERRRSLATAIATLGYSLSPMMFAPLSRWLVTTLGWRDSILVLSAIYMHSAVAACLMRPLRPPQHRRELFSMR